MKTVERIFAAKISFWSLHDLEDRLSSFTLARLRLFKISFSRRSVLVCSGDRRFQTKTASINNFFFASKLYLCNSRPSEKLAS